MQSVGIYPGTFDPIHEGHIAFANAVLREFQLDKIIFLPEANPRQKHSVPDVNSRLEAVQYATKANESLEAAKLKSPQFTVAKTLPEIQAMTDGSNITLLIGSDVAMFLYMWNGLTTLVSTCSIAIGMRNGQSHQEVVDALKQAETVSGQRINYKLIDTDYGSVASSDFR